MTPHKHPAYKAYQTWKRAHVKDVIEGHTWEAFLAGWVALAQTVIADTQALLPPEDGPS